MKKIALILILLLNTAALNAQSFTVFDVDTTDFPVMKAKFYAFDEEGNQILNLSPKDIEIYEDGVEREVLSISCPEPTPPTAISSVLTIDISGSMSGRGLENAKAAARAWVEGLPLGKSECAITSFNSGNFYNQDFTTDRQKLLEAVNGLDAGGGTEFDAGFINQMAGALLAAEKGKYKILIIFITDGHADGNENEIIQKAIQINAEVYCVTLNQKCPQILKNIATQTGGQWFENITTKEKAEEVYTSILQITQSNLCEVQWVSGMKCMEGNIEAKFKLNTVQISKSSSYYSTNAFIARLKIDPAIVSFKDKHPGIKHDTTIKVTAINSDFNVTNISSSNSEFIITPSYFFLEKDDSIDLTVSLISSDSEYTFSEFEFENVLCLTKFYSSSGFHGKKSRIKTLNITHPNGGESFVVGSDTIITWEGIPPADTVLLEYSSDNGKTWKLICNKATGLSFKWNKIRQPSSNKCLVCIKHYGFKTGMAEPDIEWAKTYGGSNMDQPFSVKQSHDGGYIIAGASGSEDGDVTNLKGNWDYWIVKLDEFGDILWEKTFGGTNAEKAYSIEQTNDDGFIIAGYTESNNGDVSEALWYDYWIVKIDKLGNITWEHTFGGNNRDQANCIKQTADNCYIIAGNTESSDGIVTNYRGSSDIWIIKINSDGELLWQKTIGGSGWDEAQFIEQTRDSGYIVAGNTSSSDGDFITNHLSDEFCIVKLDSSGNIQWYKTLGGSLAEKAYSILETNDFGYIGVGWTKSNDGDISSLKGNSDIWIVKLDALGNLQWERTLGGTMGEMAYSIVQTSDDGFVVGGWTASMDGDVTVNKGQSDCWLVKLDVDGNIQWQKTIGGSQSEWINYLRVNNADAIILVGETTSNDGDVLGFSGARDFWVVKISPEGLPLQSDTSDATFSIVMPEASSTDINMGKVILSESKDSVVAEFMKNPGSWKYSVDSIYFRGTDASAFGMVSGLPEYEVDAGGSYHAEFRFTPNRIGNHHAEIVIITQADTLIQNIYGEGIDKKLDIYSYILNFGIIQLFDDTTITKQLITNISTDTITIDSTVMLGPDKEQFSIINGGGGFVLAPGDSRELEIIFKPKFIGRTSGQIGFYYNDVGSPAAAQLFGAGIGGSLCISDDSAHAGETINIKVNLEGGNLEKFSEIVKSFNCILRFEKSILAPRDPDLIYKQTDDSTYVELSGSIIQGSDYIAEIEMICGLGKSQETTIDIEKVTWFDESGNPIEYESEYQSGIFTLLGICKEGGSRLINPKGKAGIISVSPNPSGENIAIKMNLIESGFTEIYVCNVLGEKIKDVFSGYPDTGVQTKEMNLSDLPAGIYYLVLQTATVRKTKIIEKI